MILTGENWSTGRKTLYIVGGRWMNEYGAVVEWYWQGKIDILGGRYVPALFLRVLKNPTMTVPAAKPSPRDGSPPTVRLTHDAAPLRHDVFPHNTKKSSLHLTEKHRVSNKAHVVQWRQENRCHKKPVNILCRQYCT